MKKIFLLLLTIITSPIIASSHYMSAMMYSTAGSGSSASERVSRKGPAPFEDVGSSRSDRRAMIARAECEYLENSMPSLYEAPPYTPSQELKDLVGATAYLKEQIQRRNEVRKQIKDMDQYETRTEIVNYATESLRIAHTHYLADEIEDGKIASQIADTFLDLATSLTPGISLARDLYEAISGKDLHSGEELGSFSRTIAAVGAATLGFGSKAIKAVGVFEKLIKTTETFSEARKLLCKHSLSDLIETAGLFKIRNAAEMHGIKIVTGPSASKVDKVIMETLEGNSHITSKFKLTADEALEAGEKWVGSGYMEIGTPGQGVFRSKDQHRQFRMDGGSLAGNHPPNVPHVHFQEVMPDGRSFKTNNHVPFED